VLYIPQMGVLQRQSNTGSTGALNIGSTVTTSGTASVFGTVVELIASTNFDAYWIEIMACDYALAATACEGMLDILIGTSTEESLIPDLLMGHCKGPNEAAIPSGLGKMWSFPLYIPAGSRISARACGVRLSTAMRVAVFIFGGHGTPPFRVGTKVISYGTATRPRGKTVAVTTPGEGAWTEITASTTEDHFAVVPSLQSATDTTVTQKVIALDIGVGAATEEEMAGQYHYGFGTGEGITGHWPQMPCFDDIPSGSRLVARLSGSAAGDTATDVMLHCVS